ncbi:MAG: hypothetical protein [Chaetfec virus UA24_2285]|nr:MAG: hypothetical protein [Chaetfec virus UA24_2285]
MQRNKTVSDSRFCRFGIRHPHHLGRISQYRGGTRF